MHALDDLGFEVNKYKNEPANPSKSFFKKDFEDYHLDFLPHILGIKHFGLAYENKETVMLQGVEVSIISYDDLLISKKAGNREKVRDDLENI